MFGLMESLSNATTTPAPSTHNSKVTFDTTNIIGLVVWLLCILYNCISSAVEVSKITHDNSEKRGKLCVPHSWCSVRIPIHSACPQFPFRTFDRHHFSFSSL